MSDLKQQVLSRAVKLGGPKWNYSFDNRELFNSEPGALKEAAKRLWGEIKELRPSVIYGKGVAAYPLLTALQLEAHPLKLQVLFVRDKRKTTGQFKRLVEGPLPVEVKGQRAIFVDDIYNRGDTHRSCLAALVEEGYELEQVGAAALVDFWNASRKLRATGVPFKHVFTRHELGLTRRDNELPTVLDDLAWRLQVHHRGRNYMPVKSLPVIKHGNLYVGNDDTNLYCYRVADGQLNWVYESARPSLKGTVCVPQLFDEDVYWSAYDGTVRKIDADNANHRWTKKVDLNLHSSPELDPKNDRLFIGTELDKQPTWYGRGDFVALRMSDGKELWRTPTRGMIPATPTYSSAHNAVICGNNDFHVYVLDADTGEIRYKVPTKGEVKGKVVISGDTAFAQSNYGHVYAIEINTGAVKWTRRVGLRSLHSYPVIVSDTLICTNQARHVVGLDPSSGAVKWLTTLRGSVGWGVTVIDDRRVLAVTDNGHVVLINAKTGEKLATDQLSRTANGVSGPECWQPAAYDGHHLVIVSNTRGIFCYRVTF